MANDQNTPFPVNLRRLNIVSPPVAFPNAPSSSFFPNHSLPPPLHEFSNSPTAKSISTATYPTTDDSAKKVKFLCSFGGKILPRPSDGVLRYVGGHTRIISVKRDTAFPDLVRKLVDAYGQPVIIKYQLPDEDLDALISVSSPEDLENMMDEYTKLSSDGPGKLRLFLFSASELGTPPSASHMHLSGFNDTGQRYVDAVNGIPEVGGGGLTRRGSTASATSTQNSDSLVTGSEGFDTSVAYPLHGDGGGPLSLPGVSSPRVAPPTLDATRRLVYGGPNTVMYANNSTAIMGHTSVITALPNTLLSALPEPELQGSMHAAGQQKPVGYGFHQPSGANFAPAYTQTYADPHQEAFSRVDYPDFSPQIGHVNPQLYGMPGTFYRHVDHPQQVQDNTPGFPLHQFIPTMHTTMASSTSNLNMRPSGAQQFMQPHQAWVSSYPEDNSFGTRILQLPNENIQKADELHYPPPIQLQARAYDRFQVPSSENVVFSDEYDTSIQKPFLERTIKLDDCHMCKKALPHAHSDTLVPDQRDSLESTISNSNPVFHSLRSEDMLKVQATRKLVVSGVMGEGTFEHQGTKTQPIDGMMEAVHVKPSEVSVTEQCRLSSHDAILDIRSQMTGKETDLPNAFSKSAAAGGGNHMKPVETLKSSSEVADLHDPQPPESIRITEPVHLGKSGQHPYSDAAVRQPSEEMWYSTLTFSGVDSAFATDRIFLTGEQRDENLYHHSRIVSNDSKTVLPNGDSTLSQSSGFDRNDRDLAPSNYLYSNQDPWILQHGTQFPPPRPSKALTSKEPQLSDNMKKDVCLEHEGYIKDSSEEHIKQELQAVAEDVAATVLQSSIPFDVSVDEMSAPIPEANQHRELYNDGVEVQNIADVESVKTKLLENTIPGFPLSDGIGRLQIIKNDDLEELRELGSGTFGTVYHGKWRGTDVAIKRINNRCFAGKASEQDRMRDDFWNEAIKLADLHHPNVVAFYGVVLDGPGGSVATVTEYMVNGSLRQALQRNDRTLDKWKRILIAMDVAFGMEYLHGKNIVHFDLKSDNLLVNLRDPHRPICKVGDLGLSKVKCQTLISGGVRGTLPWMAPELLNGSSNLVSEKVDVFSYGIVMWELLTGEEPYADLHYGAIIGGIVSNTLRPAVPECCEAEWSCLMQRCWSADPSDRPTFTETANQLRFMAAAASASLPPPQSSSS